MSMKKVAVIGLGAMGTPIATLLLRAGFDVTGFDIVQGRMSYLVPLGLKAARSPKEAAKGMDLIVLLLPNWEVIREVVEGKGGILEAVKKGQIIVDCSTVPPLETRAMAKRLAKKGIEWMDVPVSGAANQAREGNIVFMAGGKRSIFDKIKPVLDRVGKKTVYVGKNGDAATLKLVVNQILFLNQAAAIEGLTLGLKAGLNPDVMYEVLTSGAAASNLIEARAKDMMAGNFEAKGALWIAIKDLEMAMKTAKAMGVALPVTGLYHQLLLNAHYKGWDQRDATIVMQIYEELAGIKRRPHRRRLQTKMK